MATNEMDEQARRVVKIILSIERGVGFNFLKEPFSICCSIDDNILTTGLMKPRHTPIFDSQLIWETKFEDFQRLCLTNVPLKIEVFSHRSRDEKQHVGYMLLSLLSAKVCPPYIENKVNFTWHRLLGVKFKGRSSNPQLLLKLILQDTRDKPNTAEPNVNNTSKDIKDKINNNSPSRMQNMDTTLKYHKNGTIQIGINEYANKTLVLNITLKELHNMNTLLDNGTKEDELFYTKMTIFSKSFKIIDNIELKIRSSYDILKHYFDENPYLVIRYCSDMTDLGLCFIDLRKIMTQTNNEFEPLVYNERFFFINQNLINNKNVENPYADIEFTLKCNNQSADFSQDISQVTQSNKSDILELSTDRSYEHDMKLDDHHKYKVKTTSIKTIGHKVKDKSSFNFSFEDQKSLDLSVSPRSKENNIIKVVNELEDWMEHQKEMFKSYMIDKENKHLEFLKNEWDNKRAEYENTLQNNVEQCQNLMFSLNEIVDSLREKELQLQDREKKLRFVKSELELDYRTKYQELTNASKQMEAHFAHQLKLHEIEYKKLSSEIKVLKQENISLKVCK